MSVISSGSNRYLSASPPLYAQRIATNGNFQRSSVRFLLLGFMEKGQTSITQSCYIGLASRFSTSGRDSKKELKQLDLNDSFEVSFFTWARLNPLNDNHIVSAMYCNIIGNAYVICKQNMSTDYEDEIIKDMFNNEHVIKKFHTTQEAYDYLGDTDVQSVYFDIDLDYFTITNPSVTGWDKPTFIKESAIKSIMDPTSDFMHWVFQRIKGFTIALEPSFVGGLTKAMRLFEIVERTLFTGSIQQPDTTWRHL